ncbi:hypothetical protein Acr_27g0006710 [Actinidia rufa]|uniref:Uncharacterized protein n=1 Tax=Actinidia rufa TaxID=165716 RepID=A0A7J0H761_9ERIC|nr:hypothetical protein Acr_27g0006710 [Actinidia rufa]
MKANLLLTPKQVLDLSKPRKKKNEKLEWSWTEKISGGRGKKAMKKIVEGVEKLKETQDSGETQKNPEEIEPDFSKVRGGNQGRCYMRSPDLKILAPASINEEGSRRDRKTRRNSRCRETQKNPGKIELVFSLGEDGDSRVRERMPWEREERVLFRRVRRERERERVVTAAELSLGGELLERLRGEAARMRKWTVVKKLG